MARITIARGDRPTEEFELTKDRITIGRSRDQDIVLPDQWLSRHHAEIRIQGDAYSLRDLDSRNGTMLNGAQIVGEVRLEPGDVITLGEHHLMFESAQTDGEPTGALAFPAREIADATTLGHDEFADVRSARVLGVLYRATKELIVNRSLPELFELTVDLLLEAVPAERCAVLLLEGDPERLLLKASRSRVGRPIGSVSRTISSTVIDGGVSLLLPNARQDYGDADSVILGGVRSVVCAPLWFASGDEDAVVGMVYLDTCQVADAFDEHDLGLVTAIANLAALKIHNARLFEESLEKRQLEKEMRLAAEMQSSLLPSAPPDVPGYSLSGSNQPCYSVGGDYYDFEAEPDRALFALGDVSGKGVAAALLMTVLRATVRSWWGQQPLPRAVSQINRTLCENAPLGKYASCVIGRIELDSGRLHYVNAGHNSPLLIRADGRVEQLDSGGTVLGLFDEVEHSEGDVMLDAGNLLVVYSDGVTETTNADDEEFGTLRLAEVVRQHYHLDASGVETAILEGLDQFSGHAPLSDDRTLLVIKRDS